MLRRFVLFLAFMLVAVSIATAQNPLRLVNVTPCRLVDTRTSNGGGGAIQGGTSQTFNLPQLAQSGGSQAACTPFSLASAVAYSLNVTLVPNGSPVGYLTIWPAGESQPLVSLMNSLDGRTKANAAIVPAGSNGAVSVFVSNTTDVVIDINAYFDSAADSTALAFFPLTPCRVVDTRTGNGGQLAGGVERDFPIPGTCGIPSNAQAYSFNFTAVPPAALGFLSVWPAGQHQPVVSTLNDLTGTVVANAAIVPAGSQNQTAVLASNATDVVIDVNGYFAPASSASNPLSLYTLTPCRILDTRETNGSFDGTLPVAVVGSQCGMPPSTQAFVLNATVVPDESLGYLSLWPEGLTQPTVSTLNALDGAVTSNMAIVPSGGQGAINAFASNDTELILDISSYFAPVANLTVLSTVLPDAVLNQPYGYTLVAVDGVPPYTWQIISGSLPPGMNPLSSAGLISGTPTSTGTYTFEANVTDSNSPAQAESINLSLTVDATAGTLAINNTSLPDGTVNAPYSALLTANGGLPPYTWTKVFGPPGLNLDAGTGLLTGVPCCAGVSSFTFQVTDALQHTAQASFTITVNSGATNGVLNGTYAFSFTGYNSGTPGVIAGSFTADGSGNITGGEFDENTSGHGGVQHTQITGGSYLIGSNGLGTITLEMTEGSAQVLVAISAPENMRIIAFNQNGSSGLWGAGELRQQNVSDFNNGTLAGDWTFASQGWDPTHPIAVDGRFSLDSSAIITKGAQDVNDFGTDVQLTFNGGATSSIDANGRLTVQVALSSGSTIHNVVYVISANEMLFVGADEGGSLYIGNSLRQSGNMTNGILNGTTVGRGSRQAHANSNSPVSQAIVLLLQFDGNGNVTLNQHTNTGGTIQNTGGSSTYAVSSNGRAVLSPGSSPIVCYIVRRNEAFCINAGSAGAGVVYFEPQAAGVGTPAALSGEYVGASLPQYVPGTFSQIDSISADGVGIYLSTYSQSGPGGTQLNQMLNATFTVDDTGAVTVQQNGQSVYFGYLVSPQKMFLISLDNNPRMSVEIQYAAP